MKIEAILLPLDGRAHALSALPVASALAKTLGATLHVLHVGERATAPQEMLEALGVAVEELRGSVFDQPTGRAGEAILRSAEEQLGPLIVMCTHTGMDKPRGALGHVAEEVLREAPCPVILVQPERGRQSWSLRRILLPQDGTPATSAAMDPAGDLAHRTGAEVLVLHVATPRAGRPAEPGTLTVPCYLDQPQHEWPAWATEFIHRMTGLGHPPADVRFRLSVATGEPGREIVRFAREHEADLIVLAWHCRWEPERAATMKAVIRRATCPVLIIRAAA